MMRVELHFHLLPGVDDGPRSMDETLDLARMAVADGTGCVVATPHVHLVDVATIPERVREVQHELDRNLIPLEVRAGGEISPATEITPEAAEVLAQGPAGARWLLIEAPLEGPAGPFHASVNHLEERGFGLVIAHPERSPAVLPRAASLAARGHRLQVNASSIAGAHGESAREGALDLARRGLITALASDAHHSRRPPRLSEALEILHAHGIDGRALVEDAPVHLLRRGIEPERRAA
ncbi:MAG: protein-tyrosine phosphatase [Solirubrobacteraceae bacterium]|jgi:protein-tyrosine phosphatase|nr:protein-tyrosine phosphatase [Solirubrobacteraceae bacterium]